MTKRSEKNASVEIQIDNDVMLRASAIGAVLMGLLLAALHLLFPKLLGTSQLSKAFQTGLQLLLIWLVITSTIRSIHHIRPHIPSWKLLLAGCLTAVAGPIVQELVLRIARQLFTLPPLTEYNSKGLWFFGGLGLLAAAIATIRLRIKNRALGNMMELALIALVAFLFFYYTK